MQKKKKTMFLEAETQKGRSIESQFTGTEAHGQIILQALLHG
jgi:hypothetical protein